MKRIFIYLSISIFAFSACNSEAGKQKEVDTNTLTKPKNHEKSRFHNHTIGKSNARTSI